MAKIFPFTAYRYTPLAGPLVSLVTQPYDKISPRMRQTYLAQSPYNLVRIILGEPAESDTPVDNVYTRAAQLLKEWTEGGILARDKEPSLFAYFQEFRVPDTRQYLVRKGFIGLGQLEDYSAGVVYRHEQTLSGPKKDRLDLLRHTRAHFEQLFMLYPDPDGEIDSILDKVARSAPTCQVEDEYGAGHRLISDLEGFDETAFLRRAETAFRVERIESLENLTGRWARARPDQCIIGIAIPGGLYAFEAKAPDSQLDVATLHKSIIGGVLGIGEEQVREGKHLRYMRGLDSAEQEVRSGTAQIACLLKPTSVQQVAEISFGGGVMPQKSTDFYPKLLSGLTIYKLQD